MRGKLSAVSYQLSAILLLTGGLRAQFCDLIGSGNHEQSGRAALAGRKYADAAREFQAAVEACPTRHALLLELGQAYASAHNFPEAIRAGQQYVAAEPNQAVGHAALANTYFMAQRMPEALEEVGKALALDPRNGLALKIKGNAEYVTGKTDDAIKTFQGYLEMHPQDDDGPYMLGRIYYQERRIDYAIGQFQRALKLNPKSYKSYDNLGLCYQAKGDEETAIRYFLAAIRLVEKDHPEYDWAYANLASLLVDKGDFQNAFGAASKAADRDPYSARNFYLGGKALVSLNKTDLALNWLQRAVALDPDYAEPWYLLARVYSRLGQDDKAKEALAKFREAKAKAPRQRR